MTEPTFTSIKPHFDPAYAAHDSRREALDRAVDIHKTTAHVTDRAVSDTAVLDTADKFLEFLEAPKD